jgi:hypothetical protein
MVRSFVEQQEGDNSDLFGQLAMVEKRIRDLQLAQVKQTTLDSFFVAK